MNQEHQKKIFLVKVGVIGLTALILIFWVFNLRNVWRSSVKTASNIEDQKWQSLKSDLDLTINQVSKQVNELKAVRTGQVSSSTPALIANGTAANNASQELITDLIKKTEALASSSKEAATSTIAY